MRQESEGPAPLGESEVESADAGEPQEDGEESAGEKPDLDQRQERIRTERKEAGPPLSEGEDEGEESAGEEEAEPPDVDPEGG